MTLGPDEAVLQKYVQASGSDQIFHRPGVNVKKLFLLMLPKNKLVCFTAKFFQDIYIFGSKVRCLSVSVTL
jgi:hypothetical protein